MNPYYDHGSVPATGATGSSSAIRAEFDAVEAGFDKLPVMSGYANKAVVVNAGGTALTVTVGDLALSGALVTVGGYALTLTLTGATGLTLPTTGTLSTLAGAETLTNKTINLTSNTLTGTLAQFNAACSNADFCSLTGSETLTNKTLTSPVLSGAYLLNTTTVTGHNIGIIGGSATNGLTTFFQVTGAGSSFARGSNFGADITGGVNDSLIGHAFNSQFTKAGSGTHTFIDGLFVGAPSISGVASATSASTVRISGEPSSGATDLFALNVEAGRTWLGGLLDLSGASAGQIKFPAIQVPSADPNTLDDYEEGTWTPSIGGSATYTIQSGKYRKIGRTVFVHCTLQINNLGSGSQHTISGLPFQVESPGYGYALSVLGQVLSQNVTSISAIANNANTTITLYSRTAASTSSSSFNVIGNSTLLVIDGYYDSAS